MPQLQVRNKLKQLQHQPTACADTGSDSILLRHNDAIAATLDIKSTANPLTVRFPDGETATSIGTADVALPSTDIPLHAHVYADETLRQSLFGLAEITNLDYTAAFKKDGLSIYYGTELIHHTAKSPDSTSWTLPSNRMPSRRSQCCSVSAVR